MKRGRHAKKPIQNLGLQRAIDQLGSFKMLYLTIQVPPSHLSAWLYGVKKIPISKVAKIVEATHGAVQAGIKNRLKD